MRSPIKYQYDVKIESTEQKPKAAENRPRKIPKSFYNMIVQMFMNNNFPGRIYAYDGDAILYTGHPLRDGLEVPMTAEVTIRDPDRDEDKLFLVTIKLTNEIDFTILHEAIMRQGSLESRLIENARTCLQIIFRGNSARHNVIQSGKAFFQPVTEHAIGKGKIIKPGLSHTVILGSQPFLNVDVIYKIFPKSGNIVDEIMQELFAAPPRRDQGPAGRGRGRGPPQRDPSPQRVDLSRGLNRYQQQDLEEFINLIKGLKVEVKIENGPVLLRNRVNGLKECPRKNRFEKDGRKITVEQHFQEQYRYQIRYPDLPCLWIGPPNKNYCYPIELCNILPNQAKKLKNSDSDIRAIGSKATCDTTQRAENIRRAANAISIKPGNDYLRDFGVQVAGEFIQVESKILIPPKLGYRTKVVPVKDGKWDPEVFKTSNELKSWCIVVLDDRVNEDHVFDFKEKFIRFGEQMGIIIDNINPERHFYLDSRVYERDLNELFEELRKKFKVQLAIVVLPSRNVNEAYSRVKKVSEIQSGVLTSCIKEINFKKAFESTIRNMLLKINAKLNGVNHILLPVPSLEKKGQWCLGRRTMVLGADVTHEAPQDRQKIPSVAAVVANHDEHASAYNMEWSFQKEDRRRTQHHEIIQNLKEMVTKQLKFYIQQLGYNPERLIFFRDGVSEGEFDKVRFFEITAIKDACQEVCKENIPLTFIVVQKRHRTRFFPDPDPKDKNQAGLIYDKKNRNVPAGTVVDTEIVRQDMFECYIVSHASILGVARPTKYKALLDESNITTEELEHLTLYLCHMFNRCTRSVSYPAPTYYAHLACKRIRSYLLTSPPINMDNLKEEEKRLKGDQQFYLNNPLYFI